MTEALGQADDGAYVVKKSSVEAWDLLENLQEGNGPFESNHLDPWELLINFFQA